MRNRKFLAVALLVIATQAAGVAKADPKGNSWGQFRVPVPSFNGLVDGFITDEGLVRVSGFSEQMSTEGQVSAPDYDATRPENFELYCKLATTTPGLDARRKDKLTLELNVNPFSQAARSGILKNLMAQGLKFSADKSFENGPDFFSDVLVSIDYSGGAGAPSPLYDLSLLQQSIAQQINSQQDLVKSKGVVQISLNSMTGFVCDLSSGKAVLKIKSRFWLRSAKPFVTTFVKPDEVALIYQQISQPSKPLSSMGDKLIMAGIRFGVATAKSWSNLEKVAPAKMLKLFSSLYDVTEGAVKNVGNDQFGVIADSLDDLAYLDNYYNFVTITPKVKINLGKK